MTTLQAAAETIQSFLYMFHPLDFRHFRLDIHLPGQRRLEVNRFPGMRAGGLSRVERGRHSFWYWGDWELGLYRVAD